LGIGFLGIKVEVQPILTFQNKNLRIAAHGKLILFLVDFPTDAGRESPAANGRRGKYSEHAERV